jgi:transposase InsO family protein
MDAVVLQIEEDQGRAVGLEVEAHSARLPDADAICQPPRVGSLFSSDPRCGLEQAHPGEGSADHAVEVPAVGHALEFDSRRWGSREELRLKITYWIERTYHRRRRQRGLGKLTPIEFETIFEVAYAA